MREKKRRDRKNSEDGHIKLEGEVLDTVNTGLSIFQLGEYRKGGQEGGWPGGKKTQKEVPKREEEKELRMAGSGD